MCETTLKTHQPAFSSAGCQAAGAAFLRACTLAAVLLAVGACSFSTLGAQETTEEPIGNEYRFTVFPSYRISDTWAGFGYLGYVTNPEKGYEVYYLGKGANYAFNSWSQFWGGLIGTYTDNEAKADQNELRPFVGFKLFLPNEWKWNIYNFTRYEYRALYDRGTDDWNCYSRIRSRFGVEIPFGAREQAWKAKSWYGLVDFEPYYRFDKDVVDPLRLRCGLAYIVNDRVRVEFIYHAQFTRPAGSTGLEYTDNIFRLNIKIALSDKLMGRVFEGGDPDD
jgi:hypothetical protein